MIKAFLNLCLLLFLDTLAYMVAFLAAFAVAWAAICGARWIFAVFRNTVMTLRERQGNKEIYADATR